MSKQLYEEALADAKKLREVAEDNAKKSLIEAVTPRIRDLIERELLGDKSNFDDDLGFEEFDNYEEKPAPGAPGSKPPSGNLMTDVMGVPSPVSDPDENGKVTLDLDALMNDMGCSPEVDAFSSSAPFDDEEYVLDTTSDKNMKVSSSKSTWPSEKSFGISLQKIGETVEKFIRAPKTIRESKEYGLEIKNLIEKLDDLYAYVQESVSNSFRKKLYENKLEFLFKKLNMLQEQNMRNGRRRTLSEDDVKMTMRGLPSGIDFNNIQLELEPMEGEDDSDLEDDEMEDEEDSVEDDEMEDDLEDEESDEDEDDEEGGEEDDLFGGEQATQQKESRRISNNTVVEINENMLKREILRMRSARRLSEARRALRQRFGLRLSEDAVPSTKGTSPGADEFDDFAGATELGDPLEDIVLEIVEDVTEESENKGAVDGKEDGASPAEGYAESYRRTTRQSTSRNGVSRNGSPSKRAELAETRLRRQLEETNLFNAKLIYSNKILQNESLSKRQKAEIIERLDEAETVREAKLVYESLAKAMVGTSRPLRESNTRGVMGSSSAPTRPASTQLNEGVETERWARLAGIIK